MSALLLNSRWMALASGVVLKIIHISIRVFCMTTHALPSISWTKQSFRRVLAYYDILRMLLIRPLSIGWRLIEKVVLRLSVLAGERVVTALS